MRGFPRSAINRFESAVAALSRRASPEHEDAERETVAASLGRHADPSDADRALPGSEGEIGFAHQTEGQD